jgi:hypothetical protein
LIKTAHQHLLLLVGFDTLIYRKYYDTPPILVGHHHPPLPEEGPIEADPISATSEAPETDKGQDGDDAEVSLEESSSTTSPPPTNSKEPSLDKKRKCLDELLSSSTSTKEMRPENPLLPILLKLRFLMLWTHEFY